MKGLGVEELKPLYKKRYSDQVKDLTPSKDRKKRFENIRRLLQQKSKK